MFSNAWNRAIKFPATFNNRAAQLQRAVLGEPETVRERRWVELPCGKVVRFENDVTIPADGQISEYLRRQCLPADDNRDPREVGA